MIAPTEPQPLDGRKAAAAHVELLTGLPDTPVHLRLIHDSDKGNATRKLFGTLDEHWRGVELAQSQGYGVFLVVNEGGDTDAAITRIRALFIDADGVLLDSVKFHVQPDFIVQRGPAHWHAYWRAWDVSVAQFRTAQKRLAAYYGTDPAVCNPSRVMRLAGTLHQKALRQ